VTDCGEWSTTTDVIEHGCGVAQIGVPRVEVGVLAVAVTAMVPADHSPPGVGEVRGEEVEGSGEIEATVRHDQRRCVGVAPLVEGEPNAVGVERGRAVGRARAGIDVRGGHVVERRSTAYDLSGPSRRHGE
jgi:hypothetical protein